MQTEPPLTSTKCFADAHSLDPYPLLGPAIRAIRGIQNLEGIEEGPGVFTARESQKRNPGPSPTTYPPPKELRLQFYTFVVRGRTLSSGKAEERSFFYVGSSRNGDERHVGPEL